MEKINTTKGLAILLFVIFQSSCTVTRKFHCKDGEVITPYKDPAQSFPVYTKQINHSINTTLNILDTIKLSSDIILKNKIIEFREKLGEKNSIIQDLIKQNIIAYNNGMCYKDVRENFQKFQSFLTEKIFQINKVNEDLKKIEDIKSSKEAADQIIKNIDEINNSIEGIQQFYNTIYPNKSVTSLSDPKTTKILVKYNDKSMDYTSPLFNSLTQSFNKAVSADTSIRKRIEKFEYFVDLTDVSKADFEIIVSQNNLAVCKTNYNFSLLKKQSPLKSDFIAIGSVQLTTTECDEPNRELAIGNILNKDLSVIKSLITLMIENQSDIE